MSSSDSIDETNTETITEINDSNDSSDSSSEEQKEKNKLAGIKITKEFQENVIKYVKLDDLIKQKQEELNELKEQLKPCEQYIIACLDTLNESEIGITNGSLIKKKVEKKTPLNQDMIKSVLLEKLKDANAVEELLKSMENKRGVSTKVDLKRKGGTVPRQQKKAKTVKKNDKPVKK
jgi:DNA-binding protein